MFEILCRILSMSYLLLETRSWSNLILNESGPPKFRGHKTHMFCLVHLFHFLGLSSVCQVLSGENLIKYGNYLLDYNTQQLDICWKDNLWFSFRNFYIKTLGTSSFFCFYLFLSSVDFIVCFFVQKPADFIVRKQ